MKLLDYMNIEKYNLCYGLADNEMRWDDSWKKRKWWEKKENSKIVDLEKKIRLLEEAHSSFPDEQTPQTNKKS